MSNCCLSGPFKILPISSAIDFSIEKETDFQPENDAPKFYLILFYNSSLGSPFAPLLDSGLDFELPTCHRLLRDF